MFQPQRQCNSHFERATKFSNRTTKVDQTANIFKSFMQELRKFAYIPEKVKTKMKGRNCNKKTVRKNQST